MGEGDGGGGGVDGFNIGVPQNRTNVEGNVEVLCPGIYTTIMQLTTCLQESQEHRNQQQKILLIKM